MRSNELVERVPGHALHDVRVLTQSKHALAWVGQLKSFGAAIPSTLTCRSLPNRRSVVGGAGNDELAIGRPSNIQDMLVRNPSIVSVITLQ